MSCCISIGFRWFVRVGFLLSLLCFSSELLSQSANPRLLSTVEEVLQAYVEANGGKEVIANIKSVRLAGRITEGDISYDIVLVKKRPNLRKLIMLYQGNKIMLGYDGKTAWREVSGHGAAELFILEGDDKSAFIEESSFDGPLIDWQGRGTKIKLLRTEEMGRTDAYVLEMIDANGKQTELWLEARTMQEIKMIVNRTEPAGSVTKIETHMSDYKKIDQIWMALTIERFVNGERASLMKITDVNVNFGVFNDYFAPPADSSTK